MWMWNWTNYLKNVNLDAMWIWSTQLRYKSRVKMWNEIKCKRITLKCIKEDVFMLNKFWIWNYSELPSKNLGMKWKKEQNPKSPQNPILKD